MNRVVQTLLVVLLVVAAANATPVQRLQSFLEAKAEAKAQVQATTHLAVMTKVKSIWDPYINEFCTEFNKKNSHDLSVLKVVCDAYEDDYLKKFCATFLMPYSTLREATNANPDCATFVQNNGHVGLVDLADWKDLGPIDGLSTDPKNRFGIEDEMSRNLVLLVNKNKDKLEERFGPVCYAHTFARTKKTVLDIPLISLTVDGVSGGEKIGAQEVTQEQREAVATAFGIKAKELTKDVCGFRGLVEISTGPAVNGDAWKMMKALQALNKAFKDVSGKSPCDNNYALTGSFKGTTQKSVVDAFNTAIANDEILKEFEMEMVAPSKFFKKATVDLKDFAYTSLCQSVIIDRHFAQVNYELPLEKFGKDAQLPLFSPTWAAAKNWAKACREVAGLLLDPSRDADLTFKSKVTPVKDNEELKGIIALTCHIAGVDAFSNEKSDKLTAAQGKNLYDQMPKVNVPDLVRVMKPVDSAKVHAWYKYASGTTFDTFFLDEMIKKMSDPVTEFLKMFGTTKDAVKLKLGIDLTKFKTNFKSTFKDYMGIVFGSGACTDRYKITGADGETADQYGDKIVQGVKDELSNAGGCQLSPKFLPAAKDSTGRIYFVQETRAVNPITKSFEAQQDFDYSKYRDTPPSTWTELRTLQG